MNGPPRKRPRPPCLPLFLSIIMIKTWAKSWSFADNIYQDRQHRTCSLILIYVARLLNQTYVVQLLVGLCGSYLLSSKEVGFKFLALKGLNINRTLFRL